MLSTNDGVMVEEGEDEVSKTFGEEGEREVRPIDLREAEGEVEDEVVDFVGIGRAREEKERG